MKKNLFWFSSVEWLLFVLFGTWFVIMEACSTKPNICSLPMNQSCYCLGGIRGTQPCLEHGQAWGPCICAFEKVTPQGQQDGGDVQEVASFGIEWEEPLCQKDIRWMKSCSAGLGPCQTQGHWECTADMQKLRCSATPDLTKKRAEQDICDNQQDDNCDGKIDEGCGWAQSLEGESKGTAITFGPSGNIYTTGSFETGLKFGTWSFTTPYGLFVTKMTPNGEFVWATHIGGLGKKNPKAMRFVPNRGLYVAGCFENTMVIETTTLQSKGNMDIFVLQFDTQDKFLRAVSFGGTGYDCANGMDIDSKGRINLVGEFRNVVPFGDKLLTSSGESDAFIAQLDLQGTVRWAISLGNSEEDYSSAVVVDDSDHLYVTSMLSVLAKNPASLNKFVVNTQIGKLTSEGQWVWNFPLGEYSEASVVGGIEGRSIALDTNQNIYVAGRFNGYPIRFGTFSLESWGYSAFIAKLNAQGKVQWITHGIGSESSAHSITVDSTGQVYATGKFGQHPDVGMYYFPKAMMFGRYLLRSAGTWDLFVAKLSPDGQFTGAISAGGNLGFTSYSEDCGKSIIVDRDGSAYITGHFVGKDVRFGSAQPALSTRTGNESAFIWKLLNF